MTSYLNAPSVRSQLITRRTYSRPLSDTPGPSQQYYLDRGLEFEPWDETVERVIRHQEWLWERAQGHKLSMEQIQELSKLSDLIRARKALPSGRTLWLGGTDVSKRREATQFNCLGAETEVLTRDRGVVPIASAVGPCTLLNSKGEWTSAHIRSFGHQELIGLLFSDTGGTSFRVRATLNHRWILEDGSVVPTKLLCSGDRIRFIKPKVSIQNQDEYLRGVQHGLVYGDGSKNVYGGYSLRLFSDAEDLLPYFTEYSISYPPSCKGAPHIGIPKSKAWCDLKALPEGAASESYLIGFIRGWFAADGHVSKAGQVSICAGPEEYAWLSKHGPRFGYFTSGANILPPITNFGERKKQSMTIRFVKSSFSTEDMIIRRKGTRLRKYTKVFIFHGPDRSVPVTTEEVFCAVVPETHDFVLGNGMLTSNCSFLRVETVHDVVDAFWLLLQGCGVGFEPIMGTLSGFTRPVVVEVRGSKDSLEKGRETNKASVSTRAYRLSVGDSAEAWAKAVGKLLAMKHPVEEIILDFSQIRAAGIRLKGYGWISSGYEPFAKALEAICSILSKRAGQLLTRVDILDILNHLGTTLSSRRSAEIALVPYGGPEWLEFTRAKKDHWIDNPQRAQSNNSLLFHSKPTLGELYDVFAEIEANGGSEPGFINVQAALKRAPWFKGVNP